METVVAVSRMIHIISGFIAFFVAPIALIAHKGGNNHRRWGLVYFWAMCSATLFSFAVSLYRPNMFLFLVGVFSFYLSFSGYRSLFLKGKNAKAKWFDWLVSVITFSGSVAMVISGFSDIGQSIAAMYIVFGSIGIYISIMNLKKYVKPSTEKFGWFFDHMGGMIGSYIAAVSAFSAVNFHFLPTVIRWLWPTLIGVPAIMIWTRYYKRKFVKG
jgi:hypothetical protein